MGLQERARVYHIPETEREEDAEVLEYIKRLTSRVVENVGFSKPEGEESFKINLKRVVYGSFGEEIIEELSIEERAFVNTDGYSRTTFAIKRGEDLTVTGDTHASNGIGGNYRAKIEITEREIRRTTLTGTKAIERLNQILPSFRNFPQSLQK